MAGKNGKTRPFNAVNYSAARLAREKQRREYEQQKKEKLIFALFVVIILVMILFAILIFRNVLGGEAPIVTDTDTHDTETSNLPDTDIIPASANYEDKKIPKSDLHAGHLLLIDASHPYRAEELELKDIYSSRKQHDKPESAKGYVYSFYPADMTVLLEAETLAALNALADDSYVATGNNDLFIRPSAAYAEDAPDEHTTGRAVDLWGWAGGDVYYAPDDAAHTTKFDWIRENYHKYGFILRTCDNACRSDSSYHFLYVGIPHAYYMHENKLSLEEYLELLRTTHTFNGGDSNLAITTDDGSRYEVYYVPAEGDVVTVPVYVNNDSYSISGNNSDGFVVTVKLK